MDNKKFYGLDLLRGIAGYGVAITHYFYFVQKKLAGYSAVDIIL